MLPKRPNSLRLIRRAVPRAVLIRARWIPAVTIGTVSVIVLSILSSLVPPETDDASPSQSSMTKNRSPSENESEDSRRTEVDVASAPIVDGQGPDPLSGSIRVICNRTGAPVISAAVVVDGETRPIDEEGETRVPCGPLRGYVRAPGYEGVDFEFDLEAGAGIVTIELVPLGSVEVNCVDEDGHGVSDVPIVLVPIAERSPAMSGDWESATTELWRRLETRAEGSSLAESSRPEDRPADGESSEEEDFAARLERLARPVVWRGSTDAAGKFRFPDVPEGIAYRVGVVADTSVDLDPPHEEPTATLSGGFLSVSNEPDAPDDLSGPIEVVAGRESRVRARVWVHTTVRGRFMAAVDGDRLDAQVRLAQLGVRDADGDDAPDFTTNSIEAVGYCGADGSFEITGVRGNAQKELRIFSTKLRDGVAHVEILVHRFFCRAGAIHDVGSLRISGGRTIEGRISFHLEGAATILFADDALDPVPESFRLRIFDPIDPESGAFFGTVELPLDAPFFVHGIRGDLAHLRVEIPGELRPRPGFQVHLPKEAEVRITPDRDEVDFAFRVRSTMRRTLVFALGRPATGVVNGTLETFLGRAAGSVTRLDPVEFRGHRAELDFELPPGVWHVFARVTPAVEESLVIDWTDGMLGLRKEARMATGIPTEGLFGMGTFEIAADGVDTAAASSEIEIELRAASGIVLRVLDDDGAPRSAMIVPLQLANWPPENESVGQRRAMWAVETGSSGIAHVLGVPPGSTLRTLGANAVEIEAGTSAGSIVEHEIVR
jgi:hypothetical protein